jgi:hypothetical protein
MRCPACDMPLSPTRSRCPRCGAINPEKADTDKDAVPLLYQELAWNSPPAIEAKDNWGTRERDEKAGTFPHRHQVRTQFFTPRLGFSIAAICITVGTLLLVLVFGIARTLPRTDTSANTNQQNIQATQNALVPPTPTFNPTVAPSPSASPTSGGLKYFDQAQIGSEINNNTAQIITQSTTFQVNQKIYVTFQVHTGDQLGAACLLWHWGNNSQTHFEFTLQGSTGAAYSFMPAVASGKGNVEIYYASTTACTDKMLAQSISFTVQPA